MSTVMFSLATAIILGLASSPAVARHHATDPDSIPCPPDALPRVVHRARAHYPAWALDHEQEGAVRVAVYVTAADSVAAAYVAESCGYETLDEAALAAVRRSGFKAGIRDCEPFAAWLRITVEFTLPRTPDTENTPPHDRSPSPRSACTHSRSSTPRT